MKIFFLINYRDTRYETSTGLNFYHRYMLNSFVDSAWNYRDFLMKGRGRIRPLIGSFQNQLSEYQKRCRMRRRIVLHRIQLSLELYERFPMDNATWYFHLIFTLRGHCISKDIVTKLLSHHLPNSFIRKSRRFCTKSYMNHREKYA